MVVLMNKSLLSDFAKRLTGFLSTSELWQNEQNANLPNSKSGDEEKKNQTHPWLTIATEGVIH